MSPIRHLRFLTIPALALLAMGWPAAQAQDATPGDSGTGLYGALNGAWTHVSDIAATTSGTSYTAHFENGWEAGGTLGYTFLNTHPSDLANNNLALAIEAESGYMRNDLKTVSVLGGSASATGYLEQIPITGSLIAHYHIFSPLTLFAGIGGGMGYEHLKISSVSGSPFGTSNTDWAGAIRGKVGVDVSLGGGLGVEVGGQYYHLFRTSMGDSITTRMLYAGLTWRF